MQFFEVQLLTPMEFKRYGFEFDLWQTGICLKKREFKIIEFKVQAHA